MSYNSNHTDSLSLRRCRTVMEYPRKHPGTGLRWSKETPVVTKNQFQDTIISIDRIWTAICYCPFPQSDPDFPHTDVVSEEQNCSLEFYENVPTLLFTMWQKGMNRSTTFTNRAYNLCIGIPAVPEDECPWYACKTAAPVSKSRFCPPSAHPLHRTNRTNFFDDELYNDSNNLPMLAVKSGKGADLEFRTQDELVTLIMSNALRGRFPRVSKGLLDAIHNCVNLFSSAIWKKELLQCLSDLLWGGKNPDLNTALVSEFMTWCEGNQIYPAWAVQVESLNKLPKTSFRCVIFDSVAVYQHDYGPDLEFPHLSSDPFVEEVRQLQCLTETKDFVWAPGHTRCEMLTSPWVKNQLQIQDTNSSLIEVKTGNWSGVMSGQRLNIQLSNKE